MSQLCFLGPEGALSEFPTPGQLHTLGRMGNPASLTSFLQSAYRATKRLWVLDLHFWELGYYGIKDALGRAVVEDVRFITEPNRERKAACLEELRKVVDAAWNPGRPLHQQRPARCRIQW